MVVLLWCFTRGLLPLVLEAVEDCVPLFAVVSSKLLVIPGDGVAPERVLFVSVVVLELFEDLFPQRRSVSFENAWEVLVALVVVPFKLCRCVLHVADSNSLSVFHRLRSVVHPDGCLLPISISIFVGDVFDELAGRRGIDVRVGVRPLISHTGVVHGGGHLDRWRGVEGLIECNYSDLPWSRRLLALSVKRALSGSPNFNKKERKFSERICIQYVSVLAYGLHRGQNKHDGQV
eukprot:scaffold605_cov195-Alexandrium_tamarense.AAC.1